MMQLLGVADSNSFQHGISEIPPYAIFPHRSPSPTKHLEIQRAAQSSAQSSAQTPFQYNLDGNNGSRHLTTSHSFASLFGQGQQNLNASMGNNMNILSYPQTQSKQPYNHSVDEPAIAQLIYNANFSGLESYGASGMTILEELTDLSLRVCENGRIAGQKHHSRGAALLTSNGKVYSGCDVYLSDRDPNGISAERSAVTAAVADGSSVFHCLVLSTDTMIDFPAPDGQSREFLRSFGIFPVILVNCDLEMKYVNLTLIFTKFVNLNNSFLSLFIHCLVEFHR